MHGIHRSSETSSDLPLLRILYLSMRFHHRCALFDPVINPFSVYGRNSFQLEIEFGFPRHGGLELDIYWDIISISELNPFCIMIHKTLVSLLGVS